MINMHKPSETHDSVSNEDKVRWVQRSRVHIRLFSLFFTFFFFFLLYESDKKFCLKNTPWLWNTCGLSPLVWKMEWFLRCHLSECFHSWVFWETKQKGGAAYSSCWLFGVTCTVFESHSFRLWGLQCQLSHLATVNLGNFFYFHVKFCRWEVNISEMNSLLWSPGPSGLWAIGNQQPPVASS